MSGAVDIGREAHVVAGDVAWLRALARNEPSRTRKDMLCAIADRIERRERKFIRALRAELDAAERERDEARESRQRLLLAVTNTAAREKSAHDTGYARGVRVAASQKEGSE